MEYSKRLYTIDLFDGFPSSGNTMVSGKKYLNGNFECYNGIININDVYKEIENTLLEVEKTLNGKKN